MRPLLLWDIDGTLVRGGGAANEAFLLALRTVYALDGPVQRISYGGKTDGEIVLELLRLHGWADQAILARLPHFEQHYHALVIAAAARLRAEIEVLPGVRETLALLAEHGAIQTLLTGNLRPTAELKLVAADLAAAFRWEIGAFGSDDRIRDRLVAIAEQKARAAGLVFDRTIVIGDTPRDVQCARAGQARVIAVATGTFSADELHRCTPDLLLTDLRDPAALLTAIWAADR